MVLRRKLCQRLCCSHWQWRHCLDSRDSAFQKQNQQVLANCCSCCSPCIYLTWCISVSLPVYITMTCHLYIDIHHSIYLSNHIYQGGVLSLPAVNTQSAGLYTCHASNSEGNVTRVTKVMIKGQLLTACLSVRLSFCLPVPSLALISVCLTGLKPPQFTFWFLPLTSFSSGN